MGLRQQGDARFRVFAVSNVGSVNTGGYGGSGDGNSGGRGEGSVVGGFDGDGGNNWSLLFVEWTETNGGSSMLEALYKALDEVVKLAECEIYSYNPDSDADPFLESEAIIFGFKYAVAKFTVISLGHKENVTVAQVKQHCEMESHEEKLHKLVLQSKINETKDHMKRKASEIEKSKSIPNL
ncbi:Coatomer subunit delta-3 [Morella rubra]|uniref:Coatomer subunit delta n=1 Tax=Morella rubra TaxID=262757 RepID=A0A6A1WMC6_9ROSI|nr:Coatomer subunit delta-3 [Morella rubra]